MGSPGFVPTPTLKSRLALNKLHSTLSLGLLICKIGSSRVYVKMLSEMRQCRQDGASDPQDDPQQNIRCIQDGASDPQRPVLLPSWGDRGAEPREQRVTASCPAPHPLSAAAGPTGHTGSPLDGSPSATAARRPEHAGLAQGLPGRLPAPISGHPCTCLSCAPARLRPSVSPRPPSPCALINSYPPSNPGGGAASRLAPCSPAHPVPCCKPAPPAGSALLPWGAGPVPSHSRTLSICVSPLVRPPDQDPPGLGFRGGRGSLYTGAATSAHLGQLVSSRAGRPRVTCRQSPQQPPPGPHQERAYFWVASVHPVEAMGLGWGESHKGLGSRIYIFFKNSYSSITKGRIT